MYSGVLIRPRNREIVPWEKTRQTDDSKDPCSIKIRDVTSESFCSLQILQSTKHRWRTGKIAISRLKNYFNLTMSLLGIFMRKKLPWSNKHSPRGWDEMESGDNRRTKWINRIDDGDLCLKNTRIWEFRDTFPVYCRNGARSREKLTEFLVETYVLDEEDHQTFNRIYHRFRGDSKEVTHAISQWIPEKCSSCSLCLCVSLGKKGLISSDRIRMEISEAFPGDHFARWRETEIPGLFSFFRRKDAT